MITENKSRSLISSVKLNTTTDIDAYNNVFESCYSTAGRFIYREIRWDTLSEFDSIFISETIEQHIQDKT